MIVGKTDVLVEDVEKHSKDVETFVKYAESLVPEEFRHVTAIVDNQKYLCCLILRSSKRVSWEKKKEIINDVMYSIKIVGYTENIISASALLNLADQSKLEKYGGRS